MQADIKQARALLTMGRLRKHFDLSREELGTMLGATGEAVRAWEAREAEVPDLVFGKLIAAHSALEQLLGIFLPERLPEVIRRRAAAFDGGRALDWILDGRIDEVAEKYDRGLAYLRPPA